MNYGKAYVNRMLNEKMELSLLFQKMQFPWYLMKMRN